MSPIDQPDSIRYCWPAHSVYCDMPPSRQWTCPACDSPLEREDLKNPPVNCPHCGARIGFSSVPLLLGLVLGFIASLVVVQFLGLKAYAALLWLPILLLCIIKALPLVVSLLGSPLRVEPSTSAKGSSSYKNTLRLFLSFWFALVLLAVVYGFFTGWLAALLGAPREDVAVAADLWSIPLGLINPTFFIRPEKGLAEVLCIVTANSYFNALVLTVVFKVVHGFIKRSRVTQLGISTTTLDDDDEL
jgi:DNA-directed RNA polymerase subunit RPC12/RpoP